MDKIEQLRTMFITAHITSCDAIYLVFIFIYFYFFSIPFIIFALLLSLSPSRNSDPGSHSRLFSPPAHYGSCIAFFSREDFSSFFPRRLTSNCAYPRQALSAVDPVSFFCKEIQNLATSGFELTDQHQQHSRATSSPPGRPALQQLKALPLLVCIDSDRR